MKIVEGIIKFMKEYTIKDFMIDIKYFGSIILFMSIAYIFYIVLYYIIK